MLFSRKAAAHAAVQNREGNDCQGPYSNLAEPSYAKDNARADPESSTLPENHAFVRAGSSTMCQSCTMMQPPSGTASFMLDEFLFLTFVRFTAMVILASHGHEHKGGGPPSMFTIPKHL